MNGQQQENQQLPPSRMADDAEASNQPLLANGRTNDSKSSSSPILSWVWALAHMVMTVVFCYAGIVQLNDPDWFLWFAGYELTALVCGGLARQHVSSASSSSSASTVFLARASQGVGLLAGLSLLIHSFFYHRDHLDFSVFTEQGREAMGLTMTTIWMTMGWITAPTWKDATAKTATKTSGSGVGAVAVATVMLALGSVILVSVWAVPNLLLTKQGLESHCQGIGFGPQEPEL